MLQESELNTGLSPEEEGQLLSEEPSNGSHGDSDIGTEEKPNLFQRIFSRGETSAGPLSVDSAGIIQGPKVTYSINDSLRGDRFPTGEPRAIVLHKTAGLTCNTKDGVTTVNKSDAKPHMYICQDGTVVVNGSLDYQRRSAEKGHNDYTVNIEFESPYIGKGKEACAKKGQTLPPGVLHCYQNLTPVQLQRGRDALKLISKRHNIPLNPVFSAKERMEYANFINSNKGSGIFKGRVRGVIESYQTRVGRDDNSNHDDHMTPEDMNALFDDLPPSKPNSIDPAGVV